MNITYVHIKFSLIPFIVFVFLVSFFPFALISNFHDNIMWNNLIFYLYLTIKQYWLFKKKSETFQLMDYFHWGTWCQLFLHFWGGIILF